MPVPLQLIVPKFVPPLEPEFRPAALANRAFRATAASVGVPLILGLERAHDEVSRFETVVFPDGHPRAAENLYYAERLVKFMLWAKGGFKVYVGGPRSICEDLQKLYAPTGERQFDYAFMGEQVYEQTFSIVPCAPEDVPAANEGGKALGRVVIG